MNSHINRFRNAAGGQASEAVRLGLVSFLCTIALVGCQSSEPPAPSSATAGSRQVSFPGAAPWQKVPREQVASECGLDPALLDIAEKQLGNVPHAIIRYGKLCWTGGEDQDGGIATTYEVNSEAKTFTAALFGIVASRTDVNEKTLVSDWVTLGEQNIDPVSTLLTQPPLNPSATIFNALTQTGQDPLLGYGLRLPWFYDALGALGMNSLVPLIDKVVKANPSAFPGSATAKDVANNELFKPLGMTATSWDGVVASHTLYSTVYDMAKFGELLLRKGRWGDQQIISEDYVYRMTHPQVEDVNTSYGYLTWLNAAAGAAAGFQMKTDPDCSPFAGWKKYPHPPTMDAPSDNGGDPFTSGVDDGVFWADGSGGNYTEVHRGLDMVLVIKDDEASQGATGANSVNEVYHRMWRLVQPALIALDPVYNGDQASFCKAYRSGAYAPDLLSPWSADSGRGGL